MSRYLIHSNCFFFFQALVDDIPQKILRGVFDAANESHDFGRDSRSASPTLSIITNRLVF